ncbi:hypothetical protein E2F50_21665 [Rhizobium deserti]|uniref:Uncharacterized protein n=1 Tax=Rhizobium deserti TaxID=2547961 RepID=A0A4R5U703_9HYPH|nr:hypothetical protein [Rhizobium deserti]TDK29813.1 hypothetical protein E2F50_21665 [Rhizobium deserti]
MTEFRLNESRFYIDPRHPYPAYTIDEILVRIISEGLNTLEITPRDIDEWDHPSAFFVSILPPSWYRPARHYGISTCCYLLQEGTQPIELAQLFSRMQPKLNCRVSRIMFPADKAVSVAELDQTLKLTEAGFPQFLAPEKMSGEMQIHDLHRTVTRDDPDAIEYYTEAGQHIRHVIHEIYHDAMFQDVNVYGDMAASGFPIGFAVQRPRGTEGFALFPSFSLESVAEDAWDVYLVEDDHDQVAAIQERLEDYFKEQKSVRVKTKFPLPVSKYRLSRQSAEKLEFEEPYAVYDAADFARVFSKA